MLREPYFICDVLGSLLHEIVPSFTARDGILAGIGVWELWIMSRFLYV